MTDAPNAEQAEFWSGPSGQSWIDSEAEQDHFFSNVNDLILKRSGIATGDRVLDIGCGTGALSLDCAKVVGDDGLILATDISAPMLARAAERLDPYRHALARVADGETSDWPEGPFDHAVSRFGVMFFANPSTAFANIARGMRPGAWMTFAAWSPAAENPMWSVPQTVAVSHLDRPPKVEPNTPGPMGLADRALTVERVAGGGLTGVTCTAERITLDFAGGAEGAADLLTRIGAASRIIRMFKASEAQIDAIRSDIAARFARHEDGGTLRLPATINLIRARRP